MKKEQDQKRNQTQIREIRLESPVKKKKPEPTNKNSLKKTKTLNMGLKNIPKRRTKWIATGIFHCTEYMIDLILKFSVNAFLEVFGFLLMERSRRTSKC